MPSGKTHNREWRRRLKICTIWLPLLSFILLEYTLSYIYPYSCAGSHCFTNSLLISIGMPLGYLLGRVITPDLDQANITVTEWDVMRWLGDFGAIFVGYWMFYGRRMKHRSFWSHSYVFSSFIRMLYQFWWIVFFHPPGLVLFILFGVFVGLSVSDGIHIWLDRNYKEKNREIVYKKTTTTE